MEGLKEYTKITVTKQQHQQHQNYNKQQRWSLTSTPAIARSSSLATTSTAAIKSTSRTTSAYSRRIRKFYKSVIAMRTKHFIVILCCVVATTLLFIVLGTAGEPNDSLKSIVSQTHQQFNKLQASLLKLFVLLISQKYFLTDIFIKLIKISNVF